MARRVEDVEQQWAHDDEEDWQPSPEEAAELEAEIAAFKRGELPTVSWVELRPVVLEMIAECERPAEARGDDAA